MGPPPPSQGLGRHPGRGAPARGVDVKPSREGGPGGPEKAENSPKWAIMAKNPFFRHFWRKWPFLANFPENSPVATGLKSVQNPKIGVFPEKGVKTPGPGTPRGLLLHQPLAAGPCPGISRGSGARLGGGFEKGPPEGPWRTWGPGDPSQPRTGDRAPARGVDVKPRPQDWPVPDLGARRSGKPSPGQGEPSQAWEAGIRDPGIWSPGPSGSLGTGVPPLSASWPLGGRPDGGCFTSTPRGGALSPASAPGDLTKREVSPGRRGPRA